MCGIDLAHGWRHHGAMADIINLRRARKALARTEKERQATENRIRFGRTKSEKATEASEQARLTAALDGAKRD